MLRTIANRIRDYFNRPLLGALRDHIPPDAASQILLALEYQRLLASESRFPSLADVGFKAYSQTDEDGILLFIFAVIGTTNRRCVEVCAGNGMECNTANLIINHGWIGLLFDGNPDLVRDGNTFFSRHPATFVAPPTFVCSWITRDNINELIRQSGFEGEIDLLSIDLDGNDYWIWEALDVINPRVVVVEYLDIAGPERSVTVPYADDFDARKYPTTDGLPNFMGASLPAFVKLANRKNYRLVGCNRAGFNAFFVRKDVGASVLHEIPASACFTHPKVLQGMHHRWPSVEDCPWVEV